jgi:hypothetical protein
MIGVAPESFVSGRNPVVTHLLDIVDTREGFKNRAVTILVEFPRLHRSNARVERLFDHVPAVLTANLCICTALVKRSDKCPDRFHRVCSERDTARFHFVPDAVERVKRPLLLRCLCRRVNRRFVFGDGGLLFRSLFRLFIVRDYRFIVRLFDGLCDGNRVKR